MERGRLRTRCHHASILPRSAHAQVFGLGAKRTAARGYVIQDDAGSEENRAAGGPGPEPPILSERSLDGRGSTTIYCLAIRSEDGLLPAPLYTLLNQRVSAL
jgi:hypothetical protein